MVLSILIDKTINFKKNISGKTLNVYQQVLRYIFNKCKTLKKGVKLSLPYILFQRLSDTNRGDDSDLSKIKKQNDMTLIANPIIESLTHDSIIVQRPYLQGRTRYRLELRW